MQTQELFSAMNAATTKPSAFAIGRARPSANGTSFVYSDEQLAVIHCSAPLLAILAFAGSGKTAVLRGYAEARSHLRILYLAYNTATAREAKGKFGSNVTCKTTHGLAFPSFGKQFDAANKLANIRELHVMRLFGVIPVQAHWVLKTVNAFMHSDSANMGPHHIPWGVPTDEVTRVFDYAKQLWTLMCDTSRRDVPMPHDGYLKLFALSQPNLSRHYDLILFDEAQDANPVTTGLLMNQRRCAIVVVGDPHQSIYGFRGARNALAAIEGATIMPLTGSYRFGPELASLTAGFLYGFKAETNILRGLGPDVDVFPGSFDSAYPITTICRTNAKVFEHAAKKLGQEKVHFVGGLDAYPFEKLLDLHRLANNERPDDSFYRSFASVSELYSYAKTVKDKETSGFIDQVRFYADRIPELVEQIRIEAVPNIEDATSVVSTTHRAKGREFRQVRLPPGDFDTLLDNHGRLRTMSTLEQVEEAARVKRVVASVMRLKAGYRCSSNVL